MILGIGVDLVEIGRIACMRDRHGERFHERLCTPAEIAYCLSRRHCDQHFAARFAAKEAAAKALGTGIAAGVGFHGLEVVREGDHPPRLVLHDGAAARAAALGVTSCHLSLSHSESHAVAMVVLEGPGPAG